MDNNIPRNTPALLGMICSCSTSITKDSHQAQHVSINYAIVYSTDLRSYLSRRRYVMRNASLWQCGYNAVVDMG